MLFAKPVSRSKPASQVSMSLLNPDNIRVVGLRTNLLGLRHLWKCTVAYKLLHPVYEGCEEGEIVFEVDRPCYFKDLIDLATQELTKVQGHEAGLDETYDHRLTAVVLL